MTTVDSDVALTLVSGLLDSVGGGGRRQLLELVRGLLDEQQVDRERPDHATLLAGVRLEQERRGVLPNSVQARERRVRTFMAYLEPRHVLDADRADVQLWLDSLVLASTTRRNYLTHVDRFFAWAVEEGYVAHSPTARITAPRQRRALPRPIADSDLTRAIAEARTEPASPFARQPGHRRRILCFLLLASYAGLRAQEIAGLWVEDVDRTNGILRVRAGKGGKERMVPLHPEILKALDALPLPASGAVFLDYRTGAQVAPWRPSHVVNQFFGRLGIKATLHQCRHWFATNVYRQNADLRLTQELLGHSSPATTAIYAGFDSARAAPTVGALGARGIDMVVPSDGLAT